MPDRNRLKPGDRIRLLCVPEMDARQRAWEVRDGAEDAGFTADTIERILAIDPVVRVCCLDEYGRPWFERVLPGEGRRPVHHSLAIFDDESWEYADPDATEPVHTLRPATPDDLEFLWELHCSSMKGVVAALWGWDEREQRRRFVQGFDPTSRQLVELDGRPIGLWHVEWTADEVFLASVQLLPEEQNRGIGSRLILDLLRRAEERTLAVRLQVLQGNRAACLYERLGFVDVGGSDTHRFFTWYGRHYVPGQHDDPER